MSDPVSPGKRLFRELRRRRVFRTAALYIVGAWLVMQVADVIFPAMEIPERAIRYLLIAALSGFPVALIFGWFYDVGAGGIRRTVAAGADELAKAHPLGRSDYLILTAFAVVAATILYGAITNVIELPREEAIVAAAKSKPENSIAVLPFANISSDPENEYFCDGVSEEILNKLSALRHLHVIARTSSFSFKNSGYDIPRIAALLGVRYLLQGSVRRDGNQLRISTQLIDDEGRQVWETSFDREAKGIFDMQRDIANAVARNVAPKVTQATAEERRPDVEAYSYFLIGRALLKNRSAHWHVLAPENLRRAVEIDPQFAEAHAEYGAALLYARSYQPDMSYDEAVQAAKQALDTALSLDPALPQALAARALWLIIVQPEEHQRIEDLLREAVELDPNLVNALNSLGGELHRQGRYAESITTYEKAVAIDPFAPAVNLNLANKYVLRGEFAAAESRMLRMLEVPAPATFSHTVLVEFYFDTGRLADAFEIAKRKALTFARKDARAWCDMLAATYARVGLWEKSGHWYDRLRSEYPEFINARLIRSELLMRQGRFDESLDEFNAALESHSRQLSDLQPENKMRYGVRLALTGDFERAKQTLAGVPDPDKPPTGSIVQMDAMQMLAWTYLQTGEAERANAILKKIDRYFSYEQAQGRLNLSIDLFLFAQNALLAGDKDLAIDRFQRAIASGWRDYYLVRNDPRWQELADTSRFEVLMASVKADVDAERERINQIDAEDNFEARVEEAIAARPANR